MQKEKAPNAHKPMTDPGGLERSITLTGIRDTSYAPCVRPEGGLIKSVHNNMYVYVAPPLFF